MSSKTIETTPRGGFPDSSFKYAPFTHVRVLYASFIQGLFKAAPMGQYHWEPTLEDTNIVITDENPINIEVVGERPAVTFTRGPVQFYSLGLDDMASYDFATGKKQKSVLIPGTMSINCCSKSDLESEFIAFVIAEHLWVLREILTKQGFFEIGRQPVIGSPSPAGSIVSGDGAKEWYCTTITSPFQFYRTSQFTPLAKDVVNNISVSLGSVRTQHSFQPEMLDGSAGHELPVGLRFVPPAAFAPDSSDVYGGTVQPGFPAPALPTAPHPLNPAVTVTVQRVRPSQPGMFPSSNSIPLAEPDVEQSLLTGTEIVKI